MTETANMVCIFAQLIMDKLRKDTISSAQITKPKRPARINCAQRRGKTSGK